MMSPFHFALLSPNDEAELKRKINIPPTGPSYQTMYSLSMHLSEKCSMAQPCFRSEPWRLKSAYSETPSYIHEELLKKSSPVLYSVCERKWAESQGRVYRFNEAVSEQAISCFVSYAYYGDYVSSAPRTNNLEVPCMETESDNRQVHECEDSDLREKGEDEKPHSESFSTPKGTHRFLLHVQLYVFADTYIIPDLQKLARQKLLQGLEKLSSLDSQGVRDKVFDLMEYAFDNLREEDTLLTFLSLYASNKLDALQMSSQRFETLMLGSGGKFVRHFIPKISGSSRDAFSLTEEDCANLQESG